MMLVFLLGAVNAAGDQSISLWTILLVLAIIALLVFIFRGFRR